MYSISEKFCYSDIFAKCSTMLYLIASYQIKILHFSSTFEQPNFYTQ